jgi:hypothetical protein
MWNDLRRTTRHLWQWLRRGAAERRVVKARARFWAEVREGEREADARSER